MILVDDCSSPAARSGPRSMRSVIWAALASSSSQSWSPGASQLPIRADYVGKNIPTALSEKVRVKLAEIDGVGRGPIGGCRMSERLRERIMKVGFVHAFAEGDRRRNEAMA